MWDEKASCKIDGNHLQLTKHRRRDNVTIEEAEGEDYIISLVNIHHHGIKITITEHEAQELIDLLRQILDNPCYLPSERAVLEASGMEIHEEEFTLVDGD